MTRYPILTAILVGVVSFGGAFLAARNPNQSETGKAISAQILKQQQDQAARLDQVESDIRDRTTVEFQLLENQKAMLELMRKK